MVTTRLAWRYIWSSISRDAIEPGAFRCAAPAFAFAFAFAFAMRTLLAAVHEFTAQGFATVGK
jgi:hypothetical protein